MKKVGRGRGILMSRYLWAGGGVGGVCMVGGLVLILTAVFHVCFMLVLLLLQERENSALKVCNYFPRDWSPNALPIEYRPPTPKRMMGCGAGP